jgi:hypothetical protein
MAKHAPERKSLPADKPKLSHRKDEINSNEIPGMFGRDVMPVANLRERLGNLVYDQGHAAEPDSLQMYTEHQVSRLLQISLSQLRKWRMQPKAAGSEGPPFRKIGRLVRYPAWALRDFVNGKATR